MASTTAEEAKAPTVRWGYLYRNQADSAPGYDPPTVYHDKSGETPYILFL